jgi:hypothetical protein
LGSARSAKRGGAGVRSDRPRAFNLRCEKEERLTAEEQEIVERAHAIITRLGIPVRARPA